MDAPPELEKIQPFVSIAKSWRRQGLLVPSIKAYDETLGFVCETDFGDTPLLSALTTLNVDAYYDQAMRQLLLLQTCTDINPSPLPIISADWFHRDLSHFLKWFVEAYCNHSVTKAERRVWNQAVADIVTTCDNQPKVCVHWDYHSRNLMVTDNGLGILDFQDACLGPITYDLVSLLRDCYISWPESKVQTWLAHFYNLLTEKNHIPSVDFQQFTQWFDWAGLFRHCRAIYRFAYKYKHDHNPRYLGDIHKPMQTILQVAERYPALEAFRDWLGTLYANNRELARS